MYDSISGQQVEVNFGKIGSHKYFYKGDTRQISYYDSYDKIRTSFQYFGPYLTKTSWTNAVTGDLYGAVSYNYDGEHRVQSRAISGVGGAPSIINYTYNNDDLPL